MQSIEVLALGRIIDPGKSREQTRRMRSVTLLVPLEMATMLALAQEMGTLHLALRSERDQATAVVSGVTLRELLRTAYPVLFADEEADEPEPIPEVTAAVLTVPEKKKQAEIAVRTLRGVATGTLVMRATAKRIPSPYSERDLYEGGVPLPLIGDEGTTQ
jgi:Flp pilus assembly protein CpaB